MKRNLNSALSILLCLLFVAGLVCGLASCGKKEKETGLWSTATYTKDTEFGSGAKLVKVEVKAEDKTITFTLHTDAETVGAALVENSLVSGDETEYGLMVTVVNGMTADYNVDQSYWAFYIDGEYAMTGVDSTPITEGAVYRLEYTK